MKAAVISLGSLSSQWTIKAMKKYFKEVDDLDIRKLEVTLDAKKIKVMIDDKPLEKYDCIYAKGSYRYEALLRAISASLCNETYMPILPRAFTSGHDKLLTQLDIQKFNVPMPETYIASSQLIIKSILDKISYPVIMKFPRGTGGKGVMFAESYAAAASMLDALAALKQPFIIQEYVETGGVDIRAIVVGDQVVAAMKRKAASKEKRANIHSGGVGESIELDSYMKKIAVESAKAVGAEICAVDIVEGRKGPMVLEVNLSPGLQGITKATKIDVADKIAKYLYKRACEFKDKGKKAGTTQILQDLGINKSEKEKIDKVKEIITNLDFRGNRILLPETVTTSAKFSEDDEFILDIEQGQVVIKKTKKC
jgi:ribosomal protein S6--L-glutamate ligase